MNAGIEKSLPNKWMRERHAGAPARTAHSRTEKCHHLHVYAAAPMATIKTMVRAVSFDSVLGSSQVHESDDKQGAAAIDKMIC